MAIPSLETYTYESCSYSFFYLYFGLQMIATRYGLMLCIVFLLKKIYVYIFFFFLNLSQWLQTFCVCHRFFFERSHIYIPFKLHYWNQFFPEPGFDEVGFLCLRCCV